MLLDEEHQKKAALARRIHKSPQQVSQWLSSYRTISEETAREIERSAHKPLGWMDDPAAHVTPSRVVAHDLSQPVDTMLPPILGVQDIVSGQPLPPVFRLAVTDDSGGEDYPRGSHIIWSCLRKSRFGAIVLAKDAAGELHIRRMQQGRAAGAWVGAPLHKAYRVLDSEVDDVQIVAVFDGFQLPPE